MHSGVYFSLTCFVSPLLASLFGLVFPVVDFGSMHQLCAVSQSTESFLSGHASHVAIPAALRERLVCLTQNQAVLLGEFQDGDLRRLSLESPSSHGQLLSLRDLALQSLGRSSDDLLTTS